MRICLDGRVVKFYEDTHYSIYVPHYISNGVQSSRCPCLLRTFSRIRSPPSSSKRTTTPNPLQTLQPCLTDVDGFGRLGYADK